MVVEDTQKLKPRSHNVAWAAAHQHTHPTQILKTNKLRRPPFTYLGGWIHALPIHSQAYKLWLAFALNNFTRNTVQTQPSRAAQRGLTVKTHWKLDLKIREIRDIPATVWLVLNMKFIHLPETEKQNVALTNSLNQYIKWTISGGFLYTWNRLRLGGRTIAVKTEDRGHDAAAMALLAASAAVDTTKLSQDSLGQSKVLSSFSS